MRRAWMLLGGLYLIFGQALTAAAIPAPVTLNENCVVNVLNRTIQVQPDGRWVLPNIPSTMGQIRARATCTVNGITYSGQSNYFTIVRNGVSDAGQIIFGSIEPVPQSLSFSNSSVLLDTLGQVAALTVTATYADGTSADVTPSTSGINYASSNAAIATVTTQGVVTAIANGNVIITARKDGAVAVASVRVAVAGGDTDGDGIPDDVEIAIGLNPNDPIDAVEDQDGDGLTAIEEYNLGTDIFNADTDGDGINDGVEVSGSNGFVTNPLLVDTDGDGISDGLEIATGSDPTDNASGDLGAVLSSIEVSPTSAILEYNVLDAETTKQLTVTGHMIDGSTIDLTSKSTGTNYVSSDLTVANFGLVDGLVYAGQAGATLVTVSNNGFVAETSIIVSTFTPRPLSSIAIPGYANNVDVSGGFAYVAAGATGLQVVDVSNPETPFIAASLDTYGTAIDIRIDGNYAYIADGASGLVIMDVSNPLAPSWVGSVDTLGTAQDVMVKDSYAYVADGAQGLAVIDVSNPALPAVVGRLTGIGNAVGVDVSGTTIVLGAGNSVHTIDVTDPALPILSGTVTVSGIKDLVVQGTYAYTADYTNGYHVVDFSNASAPVVVGVGSGATFKPFDVAVARNKAFYADVYFWNGVPYVDVSVASNPIYQGFLDFRSTGYDYNGIGIAATDTHLYLAAGRSIADFVANGTSRLFIGQHHASPKDTGIIAPEVSLTAPTGSETFMAGETITLSATALDDVAVAAVNFYVDGQLVGSDASGPYSIDYQIPIDATGLTISVDAIDYAGNIGYGTDVVLNTILPYPGPSITTTVSPAIGTIITAGQTVPFSADASDPVTTIEKVELLVNGVSVEADLTAPFEFNYTLPLTMAPGTISFEMVATSATGATARTGVQTYSVIPYTGVALSYRVPSYFSFRPGETLYKGISNFWIYAQASDAISGILNVSLYVDGVRVAVSSVPNAGEYSLLYVAPFNYPVEGAVNFELRATSRQGATNSIFWTDNLIAYPGPSINIISPQVGIDIVEGDTVKVSSEVFDPIRNSYYTPPVVEYFVDGLSVGTVSNPPYVLNLVIPSGNGTVSIEARTQSNNLNANNFYPLAIGTDLKTYNTIADPLTIVTGLVVDEYAVPIVGADVKVLQPGSVIETAEVQLTSDTLIYDPVANVSRSNIMGSAVFDTYSLSLFGKNINFDNSLPLNVDGSFTLEKNIYGYDPNWMMSISNLAVIDLILSDSSGFKMVLKGALDIIPTSGQHSIDMVFDIISIDPAFNSSVSQLTNQDMKVQMTGVLDVFVDPITQQVASINWNMQLKQLLYGYHTTSAIDGSFVIWNVPTIYGDLNVSASLKGVDGSVVKKGSNVMPFVRGAITNVGNVVLKADSEFMYENDLGVNVQLVSSNGCVKVPLNFAFPFYQKTYQDVFVNDDGSLTLGGCQHVNWNDPYVPEINTMRYQNVFPEGSVFAKRFMDRVVISWELPELNPQLPLVRENRYQATLYSDGRIRFGYADITPIIDDIIQCGECSAKVGINSPNFWMNDIDYTIDTPWSTPYRTSIRSWIDPWSSSPPENGSNIVFAPNANGSYDVEYVVP